MLVFVRTWALVAAVSLMASGSADAQLPQTYGQQVAKGYQNRNSVQQFTAQRMSQQIINKSVPATGVGGINRRNYTTGILGTGGAGSAPPQRSNKPFSAIDRGPTVSPYLALDNPFATVSDYYNIVKPLQEQRRVNDRVMQQQYAQAKRLNQMAAQGPYQITGNENAAPTGHSSGFMKYANYMNTGGYFAPPTQPKSQR
jgi:hypothetical protein